MSKILVTGAAGFIGFHLVSSLLKNDSIQVFGLDNLNDYYDVKLKHDRLLQLGIVSDVGFSRLSYSSFKYPNYHFFCKDLSDFSSTVDFMNSERFDYVIHLAAQAGVRYSLESPYSYLKSNIDGFLSILEGCKTTHVKHLIYASTSSVYGLNQNMPLKEIDCASHPISIYSATKRANELMAHAYSHLFSLPTTGLRFFTVYGPWGRPDMSYYKFANSILRGKPIDVYNYGNMERDFTYIDDIVESISRLIPIPPKLNVGWSALDPSPDSSYAPYRIFNVGSSNPVNLIDYIGELEIALGKSAKKNYLGIQPGDVMKTFADSTKLYAAINFKPETSIQSGVRSFAKWFLDYYHN